MYVCGAGLGLHHADVVTAVQNAVDRSDMGDGDQLGHVLPPDGRRDRRGAVRRDAVSRLAVHLADAFGGTRQPRSAHGDANNVQAIRHLSGALRARVLDAFSSALDDVFLVGVPVVVLAFVVALALKEIPLRSGADTAPAAP